MPPRNRAAGVNSVAELLRHGTPGGTLYFSGHNKRVLSLVKQAKRLGVPTRRVDAGDLPGYGATASQPIVLVATQGTSQSMSLRDFLSREASPSDLVILLDGVTDPHNIGAIFRVADQFGAAAVGIPRKRAGGVTATVSRTSAGAVYHIPTINLDSVAEALRQLKARGFWTYGADSSGEDVAAATIAGPAVLVMGSEGEGMHRLVRERCDQLLAIPTHGHLDSLNVSVAAGVIAYEMRRRLGPPA